VQHGRRIVRNVRGFHLLHSAGVGEIQREIFRRYGRRGRLGVHEKYERQTADGCSVTKSIGQRRNTRCFCCISTIFAVISPDLVALISVFPSDFVTLAVIVPTGRETLIFVDRFSLFLGGHRVYNDRGGRFEDRDG